MDASAHSSFSLIVHSTKPKSSPLIIINYFPVSPKYSSSYTFTITNPSNATLLCFFIMSTYKNFLTHVVHNNRVEKSN